MFGADDEDGDFLSPAGGAKLASLFGRDQESGQGNESLQYTAPKQPKKSPHTALLQKSGPQGAAPALLFATAVQAFRYLNGRYVTQGKLGAALLGTHATKEYKLLLYLSQKKQVTSAQINMDFVFTVQPNNYCTFYDDQRQNWSLMFESEKASSDFCKEVCLAKANTTLSLDLVLTQDLSLGSGQGVETGDSVEVAYTGWILQDHGLGQVFDTNLNKEKQLRLKLGSGKVIKGWEEGMQGMRKSGRRLIVVPPSLAYGSTGIPDRVPAHSSLVFEAELRRVKFSRDSGSDRGSNRDSAAPSPAPSVDSIPSDTTTHPPPSAMVPGRPGELPLRPKSTSLREQLENPDATKAKLISRMAKMGQPMLPFKTGAPCSQNESSDSELEDTGVSRVKEHPAAGSPIPMASAGSGTGFHAVHPPLAHPAPSALLPVSSVPPHTHQVHAFQPYPFGPAHKPQSQLQPVGPVYPQNVPYVGSGEVTSFLMTEARQHNTEIRLAVSKVGDKVDQLVTKVEELHRLGQPTVPSLSMETSMILQNIQRLVQENDCLKKEVFDKSSRIEEQNHKIGELINQNQRYMEQSHLLLEQRNDSIKSSSEYNTQRLLQAEQEKVQLTEDLATATSRVAQLQLEASEHRQKTVDLQTKLKSVLQENESLGHQLTALRTTLGELKEDTDRFQAQFRSEKNRRKELELKLNNMEEEVTDLRTDKNRLERTLSERKRKWQEELQRRDEELDELRRIGQQDLDCIRTQLRQTRTDRDNSVSEQRSQLQVELEEEWRLKSDQMVLSTKQQHNKEMMEVLEQRDILEEQLHQLQDQLLVLKQKKDSEEQHQGQRDELLTLQHKCRGLEAQAAAAEEKLRARETKPDKMRSSAEMNAEVKRVMNGVFLSLRRQFDLTEVYLGQIVLKLIMSTIKNVTLQLLSNEERPSLTDSKTEEGPERHGPRVDDVQRAEDSGPAASKAFEQEEVAAQRQSVANITSMRGITTEATPESKTITETTPESKTTTETTPESKTITETTPESETTTETTPESKTITETTPESKTITETTPESKTITETTHESKTITETTPESKTITETTHESKTTTETTPESKTITETTPESKTITETTHESKTITETTPESKTITETTPESETTTETTPESKTTTETTPESKTTTETTHESKTTTETTPESKTITETTHESKTTTETAPENKTITETKPESKTTTETTPESKTTTETTPESKTITETTPESKTTTETTPESKTTTETKPESKTTTETTPESKTTETKPESKTTTEKTLELEEASKFQTGSQDQTEAEAVGQTIKEQMGEEQPPFGPPSHPPPPPIAHHSPKLLRDTAADNTSSFGKIQENGEEPFFNANPEITENEDEDDELNLKGRPPPTPLFGEDDDDDDLDWLN